MTKVMMEGGAPSVSATQESAAAPPGEEMAQAMETDPPPISPVSPSEDDILSGAMEADVEAGMTTLRVTSTPERQEGDNEDASR